jgi:hypothetical protein
MMSVLVATGLIGASLLIFFIVTHLAHILMHPYDDYALVIGRIVALIIIMYMVHFALVNETQLAMIIDGTQPCVSLPFNFGACG